MTTPEETEPEVGDRPAWLAEHAAQPVSEGFDAPHWTPDECNGANGGYTNRSWCEQEAMYNRPPDGEVQA